MKHPDPFLEVRVHDLAIYPGVTGLCAGYEAGEWRCQQLAAHLVEWLPEFALTYSDREGLGSHNAAALLARAARTVYMSEKSKHRGEIGELLLHIAICQTFDTIPAISKYFFKDSSNDTVKGFDAVHVVTSEDALQLWLGEVKFYQDIQSAIRDVIDELQQHTKRDYLKAEFAAITNKIDENWPHADRLKKLLHRNTSLDQVFEQMCIPVFLTYESSTISKFTQDSEEFERTIRAEYLRHYKSFAGKNLPSKVRIHMFLFPMKSKSKLIEEFDQRLKSCQSIAN